MSTLPTDGVAAESGSLPNEAQVRVVDLSIPKFKPFKKKQTVRAKILRPSSQSSGSGLEKKPKSGDKVEILLRTRIYSEETSIHGKIIDSQMKRDDPFMFTMGFHEISDEWERVLKESTLGSIIRIFLSKDVSHMYHCSLPEQPEIEGSISYGLVSDITLCKINSDCDDDLPYHPGIVTIHQCVSKKKIAGWMRKLKKEDRKESEGLGSESSSMSCIPKLAQCGDSVTVKYEGRFHGGDKDGIVFDQSESFTFKFGLGKVIQGWDIALGWIPFWNDSMKDESVWIEIPYDLGYGDKGTPDKTIPPKQDLLFKIDVLSVDSL